MHINCTENTDAMPSVLSKAFRRYESVELKRFYLVILDGTHITIFMVSDAFPSVCATHNRTYPDASRIQNATSSSVTTLFDTKTRSDASCYFMRGNAFENLQKLFKNITLYFTIVSFLSLHDIPIST